MKILYLFLFHVLVALSLIIIDDALNYQDTLFLFFTLFLSYLIGSICLGPPLVYLFSGKDIKKYGSGNIGTTNALRLSIVGGVFTFIWDFFKVVIASYVAFLFLSYKNIYKENFIQYITGRNIYIYYAMFVSVIGHMYSIFHNFSGGKGAASILCYSFIGSSYPLILLMIFCTSLITTRYVSFTILLFICIYIIIEILLSITYMCLLYQYVNVVLYVILAIIIFIRHKENIRNLISKRERKIFSKKKCV